MGKAIHTDTLGDLAQIAIAKYLKQAVSYEKLVLADNDPENLHQMRVGLRRLRTALQVFAVGIKLPKAGHEPKVAAAAQKLGELRDLDVIEQTLRERYSPDLPDNEQAHLEVVLASLKKHRQQVFKAVQQMLKGKPYKPLKKSLQAWAKSPDYNELAQLPATYVVPDLLAPLVSNLWLHRGWLVGTEMSPDGITVSSNLSIADADALISEQGPILHSLRKQVKRVRYQLKLVADIYNGALDEDLQRLTDMQTTLGDLQDSTILEEFVKAALPNAKQPMPTLFALLADSRHRAWKQWQEFQQYYLDASHRQHLREAVLHPANVLVEVTQTEPSRTTSAQPEASAAIPAKPKASSKRTGSTSKTRSPRQSTRKKPTSRSTKTRAKPSQPQ
jgi:CHAD domain-containing protein